MDKALLHSIVDLVEAQAALRPAALAVSSGQEAISYRQLNDRADALANRLRPLGVRPNVPVGLVVASSPDLVVGALGILKAGGAYLPLDPDGPAARTSFILDDAEVPVVVTAHGHSRVAGDWREVRLDVDEPPAAVAMPRRPAAPPAGDDLAYVIYTSGSTGQPKGVEVTHHNLLNLVTWHQQAFGITHEDRATQIAAVGFDAAVWELWPYLTAGASIHIPEAGIRGEPESLRDWLLSCGCTIAFVPTPLAERLMKLEWPARPPLRTLLTGGDALHCYPPASLPFVVVNNYGPTECTVVATSGVVPPCERVGEPPSIGRPILNARTYVLDDALRAVPAGAPGELYIGGAGVARGYRHHADLTAERFLPDPWGPPGARMYRTGDRVAARLGGELTFLGRADDQIKIRGYRIEPNEIASVLTRHPEIEQAAVVARDTGGGEKRLVAYCVVKPGARPTRAVAREWIRRHLPDYMTPAAFVTLPSLPVTAHGKIDREALPAPCSGNLFPDGASERALSPVEQRLVGLLQSLLNTSHVGVDDNFFHIGGHSLLAAQLLVQVRQIFDVDVPLRILFERPTAAGMAAEIEQLIVAKLEAADQDLGPSLTAPITSSEA